MIDYSVFVDHPHRSFYLLVTHDGVYEVRFLGLEWDVVLLARFPW